MKTSIFSILVTEALSDEGLALLTSRPELQINCKLDLSKENLLQEIGNYDALLVRSQTKVDRFVLMAGTKLKLVGRAGVGIDNIDVSSAKECGIAVINTPTGNSVSAAELAFALIMSAARKIPQAHAHMRQGEWQRKNFIGTELCGKTLGLIGFGNVGQLLARRAQAFDMRVIAYDPFVSDDKFRSFNLNGTTMLDEIFRKSDFLSLHCGLDDKTRNIVNVNSLAQMKKGAILINAARGELIDENALLDALNRGHLACAALDVFAKEPPDPADPLLNHPKTITTPHIGASTKEAQLRVSTLLAEQTIAFFQGSTISRVV